MSREYLALAKRSKEAVPLLIKLTISGLGMVISEGSNSESQEEHIIAHAIEVVQRSSLHVAKKNFCYNAHYG